MPVLDSDEASRRLSLEAENGVDEVLDGTRTGNAASLSLVANKHYRRVRPLRRLRDQLDDSAHLRGRSHLPPVWAARGVVADPHRLDAVHDARALAC